MITTLNIYPIPLKQSGKIAIISRPRGNELLEESIEFLKNSEFHVIVSALMKEEEEELGLTNEREVCTQFNIEFFQFSIDDRGVPSSYKLLEQFCETLALKIHDGLSVGIHCRAGIGRSSLIAACTMIHLDYNSFDALNLISISRNLKVPDTSAQENWIEEYYNFRNSGKITDLN
jgi:protein-tyrosine phosphatase